MGAATIRRRQRDEHRHRRDRAGYAANWLTGWFAFDPDVLDELGLKAEEKFAGFIHIGTPAKPTGRRSAPGALRDRDAVLRVQSGTGHRAVFNFRQLSSSSFNNAAPAQTLGLTPGIVASTRPLTSRARRHALTDDGRNAGAPRCSARRAARPCKSAPDGGRLHRCRLTPGMICMQGCEIGEAAANRSPPIVHAARPPWLDAGICTRPLGRSIARSRLGSTTAAGMPPSPASAVGVVGVCRRRSGIIGCAGVRRRGPRTLHPPVSVELAP